MKIKPKHEIGFSANKRQINNLNNVNNPILLLKSITDCYPWFSNQIKPNTYQEIIHVAANKYR